MRQFLLFLAVCADMVSVSGVGPPACTHRLSTRGGVSLHEEGGVNLLGA